MNIFDTDLIAREFNALRERYNSIYVNPQPREELELIRADAKPTGFLTVGKLWDDANAVLEANKFYAISIIGPQGSGKSALANQIAKHALAKNFKLIYALPEDFMDDIKGWIERCIPNPKSRNLLIIDDLSYSVDTQSRKQQAQIKQLVSRFKHVFGGYLLVIYITHRLHAAPPMLRNSGTWIFSAMQSADREDASEIVGRNKAVKDRLDAIYQFISVVSVEGAKNKFVRFTLEDKDYLFKWGTEDDHGDGRLMACYHAGNISIFQSVIVGEEIDFKKYRYPKPVANAITLPHMNY
jgi:hypothetical protein